MGAALAAVLFSAAAAVAAPPPAGAEVDTLPRFPAEGTFPLRDLLDYRFPAGLAASPDGDRLAWTVYHRGVRNIYGASAPDWQPHRITRFTEDDGRDLTGLAFGSGGDTLVFVRGGDHHANWQAPHPPNPDRGTGSPSVEVRAVPFGGGASRSLAEGDDPVVRPGGGSVTLLRNGAVWTAPLDGSGDAARLFFERGDVEDLRWSPDGEQLAFVSDRGDHSFVGIFTPGDSTLTYLDPGAYRDRTPRWSPDGGRLAFVRRPGAGADPGGFLRRRPEPWAIHVADVATGASHQVWESPETLHGSLPQTAGGVNLHWGAGDRLVFLATLDGRSHLYSVPAGGGEPERLTSGPYMVEHVSMNRGSQHVYYDANAGPDAADDDRRHLFRVRVDGGAEPRRLTAGDGLEYFPTVTASGRSVAYVSARPRRPPLVAVVPSSGGAPRLLSRDRVPASFPAEDLVVPQKVTFRSDGGFRIHGQLFVREEGPERRPAVIFVHGGPARQMLLGWHYIHYYSNAYLINQYLANRGFVVLSVNYRLGIGYGWDFQHPTDAGPWGASEYRDVLAAARFLRGRDDVDPERLGIWGGSYGGLLTAMALARDSDLFAAGVDWHGVHDWTAFLSDWLRRREESPDARSPERDRSLAWRSSPVADVDRWRSPVLLVHGDDDRNVPFGQTVDLVQRLRERDVPVETLVIPNEVHGFLRHRTWLEAARATVSYFGRHLGRSR